MQAFCGGLESQKQGVDGVQGKDDSEYTPGVAEGYRRRQQGDQFIDFEYFNNYVRFNVGHKMLYV